jgi:Leucine-rich repeat (LRR) protein
LLDNTAVSELTPLAGLTNLQRLDLDNTAVSDLTPLAGLTNLRELYLSGTEADTAPLKHLEQLEIYR